MRSVKDSGMFNACQAREYIYTNLIIVVYKLISTLCLPEFLCSVFILLLMCANDHRYFLHSVIDRVNSLHYCIRDLALT